MQQTNGQTDRKSGIDQLKDVARAMKEFNANSPAILMMCDYLIYSDGITFEVPGMFTRTARLRRKSIKPYRSDLTGSAHKLFVSARVPFDDVLRTGVNIAYHPRQCPVCHEWDAERNYGICPACHSKYTYACKLCGHPTSFEDDIIDIGSDIRPATYRRVSGVEEIVCNYCARRKFIKCDCCGQMAYSGHASTNHHTGKTYCYDCHATDKIVSCRECGNMYERDQTRDRYCIDCYIRRTTRTKEAEIHNHSHKPIPVFLGTSPVIDVPMGTEIEVDFGEQSSSLMSYLDKIESIYLKDDGSLSRGFEIVTHPASLDFHRSVLPYGEMFARLMADGYTAHDNSTCGLHVHIGRTAFGKTERTQNGSIGRLVYIIEKFQSEFIRFSRRNSFNYCRFYNIYTRNTSPADAYRMASRINQDSRYCVVNLQNRHTVEIRLFKGTLNRTTYLATLEMCDFLTRYTRDTKTGYDALTWTDLTNAITPERYPNLIKYLGKRNLLAPRGN